MKKQIALCIGNDDYNLSIGKLSSAVNDAKDMAKKLEDLHYDVILRTNATKEDMSNAIVEFENRLPEYQVALFYFAGHGCEYDGANLLLPTDIKNGAATYMRLNALELDYILHTLHKQDLDVKIIVLDACRNRLDSRGKSRGFAPVSAPEGTIIAFSTSPGQVAKESNGHGKYTSALLKKIDLPRIPIENMLKKVRESLCADTNGEQISWEHTSLMGDYYFNEDRVDAFSTYSSEAIADENYVFSSDSPIAKIVADLKSYNWHYQNPAVQQIKNVDWNGVGVNDMFVLGRNIYQSADGGAWQCQQFIREFETYIIDDDVKNHILSGMAFEIYFDKFGSLRKKFKTGCYVEILKLLANSDFQQCKNYIEDRLRREKGDRLVYLPCDEERYEFDVKLIESTVLDNIYHLESIYWHGKNIFVRDDESVDIGLKLNEFKKKLCEKIVAPQDMVRLKYNFGLDGNVHIAVPSEYALKYI